MVFLPLEIENKKVYAGFFKRIGSGVIDMLLLLSIVLIISFNLEKSIFSTIIVMIVPELLASAYFIYFHYKFGATLGKMAVGIKVTFPNGKKIGFKQALIRSSVDLALFMAFVLAVIIAFINADPEIYYSAVWQQDPRYMLALFPVWYGALNLVSKIWLWSEFVVLLFNKRKRAIHDYIAGTVVINKHVVAQSTQLDDTKAELVS